VLGQTETEARQVLIQAGFTVRSIDQPTADAAEKDVDEDLRAGRQALAAQGLLASCKLQA
jgi:beta-lactam-binding protein with PASTA domain